MDTIENIIKEFKKLHTKNPDVSTHHLAEWLKASLEKVKEETEEEMAHPTIPNWCCACESDKAFILGRIKDNCKCKLDWNEILDF